jgi:hypothetical protein
MKALYVSLERATGVEPAHQGWRPHTLPLELKMQLTD